MLLRHREFLAIFAAHFLTFFSSNFLKNALIFLVLLTLPQTQAEGMVAMVSATFMLPMIFLSGVGGRMADHYDKRSLARWLKGAEVAFVCVSVGGVVSGNFWVVLVGLVGMQIVGSLFGPLRSALIVAVLPKEKLALGNAWIEAGTFSAMVLGIAFVGFVFALSEEARGVTALFLLVVSVGCFLAIQFVPALPHRPDQADKMDWNLFSATISVIRELMSSHASRNAGYRLAWSWFCASLVLSTYAALIKRFTEETSFISSAMMVLGVFGVVGAQFAGRCRSIRNIGDLSLVLIGVVMLSVGISVISWNASNDVAVWCLLIFAALLSFLQSSLQIPLVTLLQSAAPADRLGRVMAGANVLNSIAMVGGGYLVWIVQFDWLNLPQIYLAVGAITVLIGISSMRVSRRRGALESPI